MAESRLKADADKKKCQEFKARPKKYKVLAFPAYGGSPEGTRFFLYAWLLAFIKSFKYIETRVVNTRTGNHIVVF